MQKHTNPYIQETLVVVDYNNATCSYLHSSLIHKWLQSPTKSWHACPLLQHLSQKLISSSPSPRFNVVYGDEFVIAHFQHCLGGRGFPIPVMSLLIVSKIACQRIFVLSDSGVPRTFVVDCRLILYDHNTTLNQ